MTDLHLKFEGYELLEEDQAVLFARTLASNTTLRHLELDASFMEIGDKYLADVVRKKRNTTLQAFACSDKSLTSKINYFCLMNRLEPVLYCTRLMPIEAGLLVCLSPTCQIPR